jgi:hypothetical protein
MIIVKRSTGQGWAFKDPLLWFLPLKGNGAYWGIGPEPVTYIIPDIKQ